MKIELTLVRLKRTREPVAVFEKTDSIVHLGQMIDEITSPGDCEYMDAEIDLKLSMLCACQFPDFATNEQIQYDAISSMCMGDEMAIQILDLFSDSSTFWIEMPSGFDYLSAKNSVEDRFYEPDGKDIF